MERNPNLEIVSERGIFAHDGHADHQYNYVIGIVLAISSCFFIGASFIIKKKGLLRLSRNGALRASAGGFGYLTDWVWWAGLLTMGIGEAANFAAFAFAPASLVTPLGGLSVLIAAVLASIFLNETLNLLGKIGCILCLLGSTVVVIHAPKGEQVVSVEDLYFKMQDPGFVFYVILVFSSSITLIWYAAPRWGNSNVVIYVFICSIIGSLAVMACKGIGLAIQELTSGASLSSLETRLVWFCVVFLIVCVMVQMTYLNKALDIFNTSIVTPIYYVFFTSFVILASAILFKEWQNLEPADILGSVCGFLTIILAIFLLNAFKDARISLADLRAHLRPVRQSSLSSVTASRNNADFFNFTQVHAQ